MSILSTLFGGGATSLVDSIGNAIDKVTTTDQERLQNDLEIKKAEYAYNTEMAHLGLEEKKADNENTASARSMYDKSKDISDAIAKRVMNWNLPFLVLLVAANIVCIKYFDATLLAIISNVVGQVMAMLINERLTIINFFFGSSFGSQSKDKVIENIKK
jgi:hypothetical protein